jgi:hypothetical protein
MALAGCSQTETADSPAVPAELDGANIVDIATAGPLLGVRLAGGAVQCGAWVGQLPGEFVAVPLGVTGSLSGVPDAELSAASGEPAICASTASAGLECAVFTASPAEGGAAEVQSTWLSGATAAQPTASGMATCAALVDGGAGCAWDVWSVQSLEAQSICAISDGGETCDFAPSQQVEACALIGQDVACEPPPVIPEEADAGVAWFVPADAASEQGVPGLGPVQQLDSSQAVMCAVTVSGQVRCWDPAAIPDGGVQTVLDAQTQQPIEGAQRVAVGPTRACALLAGGNVVCWGALGLSLSTPGAVAFPGVTDAVAVVVGTPGDTNRADPDTACVLERSGKVICWGGATLPSPAPEAPQCIGALLGIACGVAGEGT